MTARRILCFELARAKISADKVDENEEKEINSWQQMQRRAAEQSGLAIVVRDREGRVASESNNNSMCRALYASSEFAPACDEFCGKAFDWAEAANATIAYRCHANLECRAVPVKIQGKTEFVAIVGRTFTRAENYRAATKRAIDGDWAQFPPTEFFADVLLNGAGENLENTAKTLEIPGNQEKKALVELAENHRLKTEIERKTRNSIDAPEIAAHTEISETKSSAHTEISDRSEHSSNELQFTRRAQPSGERKTADVIEDAGAWRSLFGSLLNLSYEQACAAVLKFVSQRGATDAPSSLAWLERRDNEFKILLADGDLSEREARFEIAANDPQLIDAARRGAALELRERDEAEEISVQNGDETNFQSQTIFLFPVAVGGDVRAALILGGDETTSKKMQRTVARFCRAVAPQLEILRLREELARRSRLELAMRQFNRDLQNIDTEDFWLNLTQTSAELMNAERSSLLVFDEKTASFTAKAAIGRTADAVRSERETLGARVAASVFDGGKPIVVRDVERVSGIEAAPRDWKYKSKSFISYPIEIGNRKIGVLNLTERAGGDAYNEFDLDLLRAIVPQLAVLIDRAALKDKAGEFEQLSVTDALTGLLNRRYLEERLAEETSRSNRHGFPMSFMMIDVDEFKSYNDTFSHPEGDRALKLVAQHLKETLRGADVAARYGGEEFSILLPQTTDAEAATIAERVRERVDAAEFPNRKVTVSIGVASCSKIVCTPQQIIRAADKALYEAKRHGRNNVQIYEKII